MKEGFNQEFTFEKDQSKAYKSNYENQKEVTFRKTKELEDSLDANLLLQKQ